MISTSKTCLQEPAHPRTHTPNPYPNNRLPSATPSAHTASAVPPPARPRPRPRPLHTARRATPPSPPAPAAAQYNDEQTLPHPVSAHISRGTGKGAPTVVLDPDDFVERLQHGDFGLAVERGVRDDRGEEEVHDVACWGGVSCTVVSWLEREGVEWRGREGEDQGGGPCACTRRGDWVSLR